MFKRLLTVCVFYLIPLFSYADYCWIQKSSIGSIDRYAAYGFSINGKGYVCGGYYNAIAQSDLWEYDPITDAWTQKAGFPGGGRWAGADFTIGGKGYITVGFNGSSYPTSTYEYDPIANTWTGKANHPFQRQDCHGFSIGNYGYVVGGYVGGGYFNTVYRFDPVANSWAAMTPYPGGLHEGSKGFELGNIAYLAGGYASGVPTNAMYAYDPATNAWTSKAPIPGLPRHSKCAFEMNGHGFAGCGRNTTANFLNDFYEYDPVSNAWTPIPNFPGLTLSYPVCFTIGTSGYISTGKFNISTNSNQTWMLGYTPTAAFTSTVTPCDLTVGFTNSSSAGTTCSWNFGDGATSNSTNPFHTYLSSGSYNVTLVVSNGFCTDTLNYPVTVQTSPVASFVAIPGCDQSVSITNTSSFSQSYTLLWGDGQQDTGSVAIHQYLNPGSYTVTLIALNNNCSDTTSQQIVIAPSLSAQLSLNPDCNLGVTTQNLSTGGSSSVWFWGDGTSDTGNAPYHTYNAPGTFNLVLVISNGSCTDTAYASVTVDTLPVASINVLYSACHDTVLLSSGSASAAYLWNLGNGQSSTASSLSQYYNPPGNYTVTLINTNSYCHDTAQVQVSTAAVPNAQFTPTVDCSGTLTAAAIYNPSWNYNWNTGDGTVYTSDVVTHSYTVPGSYLVTLTVSNGFCSETDTTSVLALQNQSYQINTTIDSCTRTVIYSLSPVPANNVTWYFGDGSSSSGTSAVHSFELPLTYSIMAVIDPGGICSDTAIVELNLSNTGSDQIFVPSVFTPNGDQVNDFFQVYTNTCQFEYIKIFDRWGLEAFSSENREFKWDGTINGHEATEGVYVYMLKSNNKQLSGTVTIIR